MTDNEMLWLLARRRVATEVDIDGGPLRYVAEAVEMAYDDLRDRFDYLTVLSKEDWIAGLPASDADRMEAI